MLIPLSCFKQRSNRCPLLLETCDQSSPCPDLRWTECAALARCLDSRVVQTRLCPHALRDVVLRRIMTVSKMAPQSDLVSCSVHRHCLMMVPISCVVFLQKAAGFFLEPAGTTASPCTSASVSLRGCAKPRLPATNLRRVSLLFFTSEAGVPSSIMRRCSNRQTHRRWLGQVDCNGMIM